MGTMYRDSFWHGLLFVSGVVVLRYGCDRSCRDGDVDVDDYWHGTVMIAVTVMVAISISLRLCLDLRLYCTYLDSHTQTVITFPRNPDCSRNLIITLTLTHL